MEPDVAAGRGQKPGRGRGRDRGAGESKDKGDGERRVFASERERQARRAETQELSGIPTTSGLVAGRCTVVAVIGGSRRPAMLDGCGRVKLPPASLPSFAESILSHLVPDAPLTDPPSATPAGGDGSAGRSSAEVEVWQDLSSRTIFVYLPPPGDPPPVPVEGISYLAVKEEEHVFLRRALQLFSCSHLVLLVMSSSRFDPAVCHPLHLSTSPLQLKMVIPLLES